jgi:hypothetical protein
MDEMIITNADINTAGTSDGAIISNDTTVFCG